jgi:hypothetical protein
MTNPLLADLVSRLRECVGYVVTHITGLVECRYYAFPRIVEMKIWRVLSASRKAEKLIAIASSCVCLTISTLEL